MLSAEDNSLILTLRVQLAITSQEHALGLMYRGHSANDTSGSTPRLPDNEGMLFLFPEESRQVLWMQNTYVPLDAAWFSRDGHLLEKSRALQPLDETYMYSNSPHVRFELETNQDFWQSHGLNMPGKVKLDVSAIRKAITQRDFDANLYAPLVINSR